MMKRKAAEKKIFLACRGRVRLRLLLVVLTICLAVATGVAFAATQSGTVAIEALNVRSGPGTLNQAIGTLYAGQTVTIEGTEKDYMGTTWYRISWQGGSGYVSADYIVLNSDNEYVYDENFEAQLTAQGFPESYKPYLRKLHADYPAWVFKACQTGLSWRDAVAKESQPGVSLISGTSPSSWKSMEKGAYDFDKKAYVQYDSGNWVTAAQPMVEYYMDPRNFLHAGGIFQFLTHAYDGSTQSLSGLSAILDGTFMRGDFPENGHGTYGEVLMEAGQMSEVNPYVLASMILVEQGSSGNGGCISGTVSGYEGIYNHFNIGAYASGGMSAVTRGLWYASSGSSYGRPWNSRYKSILGGAEYYGENYVRKNKNTLYLKKFNVMNGLENVGVGQYMTNIQGAESEAAKLRIGYLSVIQEPMTFEIPVYTNMPTNACLKPTSSANNNNYLSRLSVSGCKISPTFDRYTTAYTVNVGKQTSAIEVVTGKSASAATVTGDGRVKLTADKQTVKITVTAASGLQRVYTLTVRRTADGETPTTPSTPPTEPTDPVDKPGTTRQIGDVNGDGTISGADADAVQAYLLGSASLQAQALKAADVNGDGRVNSLDVLYIRAHVAGRYKIGA